MQIQRTDLMRLGKNAPPSVKMLMSGEITIAEMRAMRPLPENAQKLIDDAVVRVGLQRLTVVADILAEGLTFDIGQDFWGITQLQWDEINEVGAARRTMEPQARGEFELPDRRARTLPIYLTWDDFELGIRTLRASQRGGAPLDTTLIEQKTRRVNEAIEDAMINGIPVPVFGSTVYGLLNAPNVNTYTYLSNEAWDAAGKTGDEIIADVIGMSELARADGRYGPYNLYVNAAYGAVLNKNYTVGTTAFPDTILERIERMVFGGRTIRVRISDLLPTNRTVLVQMTSDVVDVVVGQQPTVISWEGPSGFDLHWIVLAAMIPRLKTTYTDQSGVVTGNV